MHSLPRFANDLKPSKKMYVLKNFFTISLSNSKENPHPSVTIKQEQGTYLK